MILVTAAAGNQGRFLIPKQLARGIPVRASVRSNASAATLRALAVDDVIVGDLADANVQGRAVRGTSKVYHVGATLDPGERDMGIGLIDAARAEDVEHFVFSSVLHSIITDLSTKSSATSRNVCSPPTSSSRSFSRRITCSLSS